ncbi:MAG: redoxin domain-containing protein [Salinibacterium sp.]|nr:redoxin domain-containing protein [Salinibacterium sp.]
MIKRVFVEGTSVIGLALIVIAGVAALNSGDLGWLGVVLAWLPVLSYYGYLLLAAPSTRSRNLWAIFAISAAGVLVAAFAGPVALVAATGGLAAALLYTYWYSRQHVPAAGLTVGMPLPEFALTTLDGELVSSAVLADRPHVIMFYRGNWCPFCMVQIKQIADQYRELEARGVGVALISPQRADDTAELATRFELPLQFFVDTDGAAADLLDLTQSGGTPMLYGAGTNGDTVVPTVVITDAEGRVVWLEHADNHRIRPEPSTFLEVLDREGIGRPR